MLWDIWEAFLLYILLLAADSDGSGIIPTGGRGNNLDLIFGPKVSGFVISLEGWKSFAEIQEELRGFFSFKYFI
jgi:hypothetical protein